MSVQFGLKEHSVISRTAKPMLRDPATSTETDSHVSCIVVPVRHRFAADLASKKLTSSLCNASCRGLRGFADACQGGEGTKRAGAGGRGRTAVRSEADTTSFWRTVTIP